jgi:hypothetical protein
MALPPASYFGSPGFSVGSGSSLLTEVFCDFQMMRKDLKTDHGHFLAHPCQIKESLNKPRNKLNHPPIVRYLTYADDKLSINYDTI